MIKRLTHILLTLPMLALLTACPNPPPAEESCNFVQNSFSRRVSWARLPVEFYADDSLNDQQVRGLLDAMEVWNNEFDRPVLRLIGRTGDLPNPRMSSDGRVIPDAYNAIYVVDPNIFENSPFRDEQARASISFRGDHIYETDILIDGSEQFYYTNQEIRSSSQRIQFKSLMVHELGHALGLGHIDAPGENSVMHPKLQYGEFRAELAEIDRESLACEYQ